MNNALRIAVAAVAVIVVAVLGFQLLSGPDPGSQATPTPTPTLALTPMPTPAATLASGPADFAAVPDGAALEAGTYLFSRLAPLQVTFTIPDGWARGTWDWVLFSDEDIKAYLAADEVENLFTHPCEQTLELMNPPVGPAVDDLAAALAAMPAVTFSAPTDIVMDGYPGVELRYVPGSAGDCSGRDPYLWPWPGTADRQPAPIGDEAFTVRIVDADGTRLVITTRVPATGVPPARLAELDAILESFQIE